MDELIGRILLSILRCLCGEKEHQPKGQNPQLAASTDCNNGDQLCTPLVNHGTGLQSQGLLVALDGQSQASNPFVLLPGTDRFNLASPAPAKPCQGEVLIGAQLLPKALQVKKPPRGRSVAAENEIWKKHYCSSQKILLVGEGDFSFSSCLAMAFGSAVNITATSLNAQEFLSKNYAQAMANIQSLKAKGGLVMHKVDATKMAKHPSLKGSKFDRIVFNFPHAGFSSKETSEAQIGKHQKLIRLFFKNARKLINEDGGEVHITHKTNGFHRQWDLEGLASGAGFTLAAKVKFSLNDYPGYNTKYGFGGDKNFDCNPSRTYKFAVQKLST